MFDMRFDFKNLKLKFNVSKFVLYPPNREKSCEKQNEIVLSLNVNNYVLFECFTHPNRMQN